MSKVSKLKKLGIMLIVSGMLMSMLTACGGSKTAASDDTQDENTTAQTDTQDQTDPDENYETGDASLDDPLNQDEIGETELLVVSFGTSYNDNRRETIGAIEKAMQAAFPELSVRLHQPDHHRPCQQARRREDRQCDRGTRPRSGQRR